MSRFLPLPRAASPPQPHAGIVLTTHRAGGEHGGGYQGGLLTDVQGPTVSRDWCLRSSIDTEKALALLVRLRDRIPGENSFPI